MPALVRSLDQCVRECLPLVVYSEKYLPPHWGRVPKATHPTVPTSAGLHSGGRWPAPSSSLPESSSSSLVLFVSSHSSAQSEGGGEQGRLARDGSSLSPDPPNTLGSEARSTENWGPLLLL